MTQKIQQFIIVSFIARWSALILIALMMFFAYMFVDMLSPLKELLDTTLGWNSSTFGTYAASEYFLNVFCFFLFFEFASSLELFVEFAVHNNEYCVENKTNHEQYSTEQYRSRY